MRIINRYIFKEFFVAFFLSLLILSFVMILGNVMSLIHLIITKGVSLFMVLRLFYYMLPYLFPFIVPISILAGLLLSLGRLSADNEIITMRSSGLPLTRIIAPFLVLGLIFSLIAIIINDRVIPHAHLMKRKIMYEIGTQNPTAAFEAGEFIDAFEKYIIFVYHIDGNKFRNIRIYEPQGEGKPPRTIIAKRGEFIVLPERNMMKLKLIDGTSDEINPTDPENFYKINFHTYFMNIDFDKNARKKNLGKKRQEMTIQELKNKMKELHKQQIYDDPLSTELHKRIALSFSNFIFFLIGVPLGIITQKRARTSNIVLAFIVVGVYFILSLVAKGLCTEGNLAPSSGMWIPNIIFAIIGIILSIRLCAS